MIEWEWVAGDTAPQKAQYLKNGKPSTLAGATVKLALYDIKAGSVEVDDLTVALVDSGTNGEVTFSPTADEDAATFIPAGKYFARFRITDAGGVVQQVPVRKRNFEVRVWSEIEEQD